MSRPELLVQLLAVITMVGATGCGKSHPPVAEVRGIVSYQGRPVAGGRVMFLPNGGGKQGLGTIQPDGSYQLGTFGTVDGALVGKHHAMLVRVAMNEHANELESFRRLEDQNITVEADKVNQVDIDLSSPEWQNLKD